jgi:two-component system, sensor histidine kinase
MTKKILVVDDNYEDLTFMKNSLESVGYTAVAVTNGAKALDALVDDGFDLILIDIKMPTLSGYDLLRLLREKVNHNAKMVYVSIVRKKDVDMTDIDGFIQKPVKAGSLVNHVKKVIGK